MFQLILCPRRPTNLALIFHRRPMLTLNFKQEKISSKKKRQIQRHAQPVGVEPSADSGGKRRKDQGKDGGRTHESGKERRENVSRKETESPD